MVIDSLKLVKRSIAWAIVVLVAAVAVDTGVCESTGIGELIESLKSNDVGRRLLAVNALGRSDDASGQAVAALVTAILDPDESVRSSAVMALGRMNSRAAEAVPQLALALGDEALAVSWSALQAIRRITGSADPYELYVVPAIRDALRSAEPRERMDAVRAYGRMPDDIRSQASDPELSAAVARVLVEALADKSDGVRMAAVRVLSRSSLADVTVVQCLPLLCGMVLDSCADTRLEVVKALSQFASEEPDGIRALALALGDPDSRVRDVAVASVASSDFGRGGVISPLAVRSLVSSLYDDDIMTSDAAARALVRVASEIDADQLEDLESAILEPLGGLIATADSYVDECFRGTDAHRCGGSDVDWDRLPPAIEMCRSLQSGVAQAGTEYAVREIVEGVLGLRQALSGQDSYLLGSVGIDGVTLTIREQVPDKLYTDVQLRVPQGAFLELPPWVMTFDGRTDVYIPCGVTFRAGLLSGRSLLDGQSCLELSVAEKVTWNEANWRNGLRPPEEIDDTMYWRQSYYGLYDGYVGQNTSTGDRYAVAVVHGENKNELRQGYRYVGNILPDQGVLTLDQFCGSHSLDGSYRDYWPAYFAFVCMTYSALNDPNGCEFMEHDLGPVLWPSAGYLDANGHKTSDGLRHPSIIVVGDYAYVFYLDQTSIGTTETGRQSGVKVARASIGENGLPGPFYTYFNGQFSEPSLPVGFDKSDRSFLQVKGGRSSKIIDTFAVRFSVAKLEGTPYFLAAEDRVGGAECGLYLRVSRDLVNWSEGTLVPGTAGTVWGNMPLHYPVFSNTQFTDNKLIDPDGFYVIGSVGNGRGFRVIYLEVDIEEVSDCD